MKLLKRTQTYKGNNVTFDPKNISAYSYLRWKFVGLVDGYVVFNNYRYSNTTSRHQSKVLSVMRELGIDFDYMIPIPEGLPGTYHRYGQGQKAVTLEQCIVAAEEYLCDEFLTSCEKNIRASERARENKAYKKSLEQRDQARREAYQSIPDNEPTVIVYQGLRLVK